MLFNFSKKFDGFHALLYSDSKKGNVHDVDSRKKILDNLIIPKSNHISLPIQTHSRKVVWAKEDYAHESSDGILSTGKEGEYVSEHIADAKNTPLDFLNEYLAEFPEKETFYVHCAGGYRSMIAASILKSRGIHNLIDVAGGFKAIKEADIPVTNYVCPSTLK